MVAFRLRMLLFIEATTFIKRSPLNNFKSRRSLKILNAGIINEIVVNQFFLKKIILLGAKINFMMKSIIKIIHTVKLRYSRILGSPHTSSIIIKISQTKPKKIIGTSNSFSIDLRSLFFSVSIRCFIPSVYVIARFVQQG